MLLVRNIYTEADLNEMAKVCQGKGLFGFEASRDKVYKHLAGLSDFDLHQVCNESQLKAGGVLRSSTRPTSCFDEPSPLVCMSIHPEGKSSGHV